MYVCIYVCIYIYIYIMVVMSYNMPIFRYIIDLYISRPSRSSSWYAKAPQTVQLTNQQYAFANHSKYH